MPDGSRNVHGSPAGAQRSESSFQHSGERKRRRTSQACLPCRRRKSRCNGARPTCSSCTELDYNCVYGSAQQNLAVGSQSSYLETLENRLASLEHELQQSRKHDKPVDPTSGGPQTVGDAAQQGLSHSNNADSLPLYSHDSRGEQPLLEASVRPLPPDESEELARRVLFRGVEPEVYHGSSSLMAFARDISGTLKSSSESLGTEERPPRSTMAIESGGLAVMRPGSPIDQVQRSTIPSFVIHDMSNDLFLLPTHSKASDLIDRYFNGWGSFWPYINEVSFRENFHNIYHGTSALPRIRLSMLNMAFALAIQRSLAPDAESTKFESYKYYTRAVQIEDASTLTCATLETVQYFLQRTQFLMGTGTASETWVTHGLAVKAAFQIGLHSEETFKQLEPSVFEIRKHTWWTCFILDRTLSMGFGRPPSIPTSYMKVYPSFLTETTEHPREEKAMLNLSAKFLSATVSISTILGNILEVMYDSNLGKTADKNPFEAAADILQLELEFSKWKFSLPPWLQPKRFEGLPPRLPSEQRLAQYRIILTLRFHTFRCLAHRPMLVRLLRVSSACGAGTPADSDLQHVGKQTLEDCANSATEVVEYVHAICTAGRQQQLLGTWWCSLFYTFSAALNLFSILIIYTRLPIMQRSLPYNPARMISSFQNAVEVVECLRRENRTTAKCGECLKQLYQFIPHESQGSLSNDDANIGHGTSFVTPSSTYNTDASLATRLDKSPLQDSYFDDLEGFFDQDFSFLDDLMV